uniref:Ferredoxin n=1 Tax=Pterocladiophila hemisphaerica TaxID=2712948 RepID=A0A6M3WWG6_9FLOR|nr:PetF [Pterocladiophila hemisphaerica]
MTSFEVKLLMPKDKSVVIRCNSYLSILDQAENKGIILPYSCRAGACSSCAGLLKKGTVDQSDQSYLDDEQLKQNWVLTCLAYPTSDCIILTSQESNLI